MAVRWWPRLVGYVAAGGGSVLLDVTTLMALRSGLGAPLALSTTIAFFVGLASNFLLNRYAVFSSESSVTTSGSRYLTLVAFNYAVTILIVTGLSGLGVSYLIGKGMAVAVTLAWNFLAYSHWVFPDHDA